MLKENKKSYLFGLSAILFWSTIATAFSLALRVLSVSYVILIGSVVAIFSILIIGLITKSTGEWFKISKASFFRSAFLGFLNPFLYYLLLLKAYSILPAQEALVMNYIWPVSLVLLSIPLLKQKIKTINIAFILISFLGAIIIATKGQLLSLSFTNWKGDLLAFGSSIIWALYWIYNMKDKREETAKLILNFIFGTVYIALYISFTEGWQMPKLESWLPAIWVGLFELGITFYLWLKALALSSRTDKISGLVYLSPFLSLIFIAIILKEEILLSTFVGLVFIIIGIILNQRYLKKNQL